MKPSSNMVGARGFEPPTFRPPAERATKLRHAPKFIYFVSFYGKRDLTFVCPGLCEKRLFHKGIRPLE
jgi:hypothetical protein